MVHATTYPHVQGCWFERSGFTNPDLSRRIDQIQLVSLLTDLANASIGESCSSAGLTERAYCCAWNSS